MTSRAASPSVSVVIPCYQSAGTIEESVGSILAQTWDDLEVVVVDDGSTDGTGDLAERIPDPRVRVLRRAENAGTSVAFNEGIAASRGAYVARMDADDLSLPRRIEAQVRFLEAHPSVGLLGTRARKVRPGRRTRVMVPLLPPDVLRARFVLDWSLHHPTVMMRRSVLERMDSWYDPALRRAQDRDLWLRMAMITDVDMLPRVHLIYRGRDREGQAAMSDRIQPALRLSARKRIEIFLRGVGPAELRAAEALGSSDRSLDDVPLADLNALADRVISRAVELRFCSARAMASSMADLMFARLGRNSRARGFEAIQELVRRHRVPLQWMTRLKRRTWYAERLRRSVAVSSSRTPPDAPPRPCAGDGHRTNKRLPLESAKQPYVSDYPGSDPTPPPRAGRPD